jgi:hypothetical protein
MLEDMRAAEVPDGTSSSLMAQSDAYFSEIYRQAMSALMSRGMSREDAAAKLREIFGNWTP